jgi:hypothetical protein
MAFVTSVGRLRIFAARTEDVNEGFVWARLPELPVRDVIKIINSESGESVHCEVLQIDPNFLRIYNQHPRIQISDPECSIVMAEWYRVRLGGLETQKEYKLKIVNASSFCGKVRACLDHPQTVVRVATWLGIWSFFLGLVGISLGALSICLAR